MKLALNDPIRQQVSCCGMLKITLCNITERCISVILPILLVIFLKANSITPTAKKVIIIKNTMINMIFLIINIVDFIA